ncbi:MAG: hypothetical protein H6621_01905 [Halobacteriovoraceae bacterium]|nr:hypothetical protein [Halobacteriovoraceae bacterium]MCB9093796.1 hypothetical protein [Halobacteriovoraceae bacterium]
MKFIIKIIFFSLSLFSNLSWGQEKPIVFKYKLHKEQALLAREIFHKITKIPLNLTTIKWSANPCLLETTNKHLIFCLDSESELHLLFQQGNIVNETYRVFRINENDEL